MVILLRSSYILLYHCYGGSVKTIPEDGTCLHSCGAVFLSGGCASSGFRASSLKVCCNTLQLILLINRI